MSSFIQIHYPSFFDYIRTQVDIHRHYQNAKEFRKALVEISIYTWLSVILPAIGCYILPISNSILLKHVFLFLAIYGFAYSTIWIIYQSLVCRHWKQIVKGNIKSPLMILLRYVLIILYYLPSFIVSSLLKSFVLKTKTHYVYNYFSEAFLVKTTKVL